MRRITLLISILFVVLIIGSSFGQRQDDNVLYDPTPRSACARHIQLPEKYSNFIFEFVNKYVGKAGADKSEDWWHQKGPFLTLYKIENSNEFDVVIRRRSSLRSSCYYTYLGKYLLVSNDPFFEKYIDDGDTLKYEFIHFAFIEDPFYWSFEEKDDSLYITDKYTPYDGAWRLIE